MAGKLPVQGSGGNFLDMIMRVAFLLLNNVFIIWGWGVAKWKHPDSWILVPLLRIEKSLISKQGHHTVHERHCNHNCPVEFGSVVRFKCFGQ